MIITLPLAQESQLFAYTGGKAFNANQPTVIMVHGVLNDHSVWYHQSRHLANQGWNVLAIDLPGQGKSTGAPPATVEEGAQAVLALIQALKLTKVALIGHSFGSLICLHAASVQPENISHLVLVGTAYPMPVSAALMEASVAAPEKAIAMVNQFSHSKLALVPNNQAGGFWTYGASRALMRKMLASNTQVNVFFTGFKACDSYRGGEQAMHQVTAPVLFVLGRDDLMTPPKAAALLQKAATRGQTTLVGAGHAMMVEAPDEVLNAIKTFLS